MINIQEWFSKQHIPESFIDKEKIYISEEGQQFKLNFPVFNKKGDLNSYSILIDENGVLDENYTFLDKNDIDLLKEKDSFNNFRPFKVEQLDICNSETLGLQNVDKNNKIIYFTMSPLDRLFLLSLKEKNVINIPPSIFEEENNFFDLFTKKIDLNNINKILLCFPDNEQKQYYEDIISSRIDKSKLLKMNLNFLKDLELEDKKEFKSLYQLFPMFQKVNKPISEEFFKKQLLDNGKTFPIKGIYELNDFEAEIDSIYKNGIKKGANTGWDNLDNFFRPKTKHVTVVYGIPEHGKSTFIKCISLNFAKTVKWKTAFFSFEDDTGENFFHEMIEKTLLKSTPFHNTEKRTKEVLQKEEYINAKNFVKQNIKLLFPDENEYGNENFLDSLLELFAKAITIYGIKNIVLDPWNQIIQSRPSNYSEAEYLSHCLGKINQFAKNYDVHVFIAAHPSKMQKDEYGNYKIPTLYDISGGANWFNKVSTGICIYRKVHEFENKLNKITCVFIQKCKRKDIGRIGMTYLATGENSEMLLDIVDCAKYDAYIANSYNKKEKVNYLDFINTTKINKIDKNTKIQEINSMEDLKLNKNEENQIKNSKLPF